MCKIDNDKKQCHLFLMTTCFVVCGILLRFYQYFGNKSLWLDEASLAVNVLELGFKDLLGPLPYRGQASPVGFLICVKLLTILLGDNEFALRLLPFLSSIAAIVLFAFLSRCLINDTAGSLATGLFAFAATPVFYAAEFKQYSVDLLFSVILLIFGWWAICNSRTMRSSLVFGVIGAISVWFSHPAIFLVVGIGGVFISLEICCKNENHCYRVKRITASLALPLVSFLINYALFVRPAKIVNASYYTMWQSDFAPFLLKSLTDLLWYLRHLHLFINDPLSLNSFQYDDGLAYMISAIVTMMFVIGLFTIWNADNRIFLILLSPVVVVLSASMLNQYPLVSRFTLFLVPIWYLAIAAGFMSLLEICCKNKLVVIVIINTLILLVPFMRKFDVFNVRKLEETRVLINYIKHNIVEGDNVYIYYGAEPAFRYYNKDLKIRHINGTEHRNSQEKYIDEVSSLENKGRVWILFSHIYKNEETLITNYLSRIGKRELRLNDINAALYLYKL